MAPSALQRLLQDRAWREPVPARHLDALRLAEQLLSLNRQLARPGSSEALLLHITAASIALQCCVRAVMDRLPAGPAGQRDGAALAAAAALFVHAGQAALAEQLPLSAGRSRGGMDASLVIDAATEQAVVVTELLALLADNGRHQLFGAGLQPAALARWLGTVAGVQALEEAHGESSPDRGGWLLGSFLGLTGTLFADEMAPLHGALLADGAAQLGMLDMLFNFCLPEVRRQVVDGGAPDGGSAWPVVALLFPALAMPGLQQGLRDRMHQGQGSL
ncbi:hypothetical protein ABPG75_011294 [Micractinium tetrahymenae]